MALLDNGFDKFRQTGNFGLPVAGGGVGDQQSQPGNWLGRGIAGAINVGSDIGQKASESLPLLNRINPFGDGQRYDNTARSIQTPVMQNPQISPMDRLNALSTQVNAPNQRAANNAVQLQTNPLLGSVPGLDTTLGGLTAPEVRYSPNQDFSNSNINYTPQVDNFNIQNRELLNNRLNELLGSYRQTGQNSDNSFGSIFRDLTNRAPILKELNVVASLLKDSNQLANNSINNVNNNVASDVNNQRGSLLDQARIEQSNNQFNVGQDNNQFTNQLKLKEAQLTNQDRNIRSDIDRSRVNAAIVNSNNDSLLKNQELIDLQPQRETNQRVNSIINNPLSSNNFTQQQLSSLLTSPESVAEYNRRVSAGESPEIAAQNTKDFIVGKANQNTISNIGLLKQTAEGKAPKKELPKINYEDGPYKIEGTDPNSIINISAKLTEAMENIKDPEKRRAYLNTLNNQLSK